MTFLYYFVLYCLYMHIIFLIDYFQFNHHNAGQNPLSYVVLIISFVLAWVETWFLDFKVVPVEKKHRQKRCEFVYYCKNLSIFYTLINRKT